MKLELKNFKSNERMSDETNCFTADMWVNGKKIGMAMNRGHGGPTDMHYTDVEAGKAFEAYCKSLPPKESKYFPEGLKMDAELFVDELVEEMLRKKADKALCRGKTAFRLKSETYKEGEWLVSKVPFTPLMKETLVKRYGADLGEILNELVA